MQILNNKQRFFPIAQEILKHSFGLFTELYTELKSTGFCIQGGNQSGLADGSANYTIQEMIIFMRVNIIILNALHYYFDE